MAIDAQQIRQWIKDNPRHLAVGVVLFFVLLLVVRTIYVQMQFSEEEQTTEKEKKEKDKKKKAPKPDFDPFQLVVLPGEPKQGLHPAKPGHWYNASLETRANNFDFLGQITSSPADTQGNPIDLFQTPYRMVTTRAAVLPKTQKKSLELTFFVPQGRPKSWLAHRLLDRYGRDVKNEMDPLDHMPGYQYYFFVMARDATRYGYIKVLDSTVPPLGGNGFTGGDITREGQDRYYQVVTPLIKDNKVLLPSQPLTWSSVAYVLWDDIDPTLLTPEQQQSLVDWIHWGGQLVVSGPQTLDLLKSTFIEPYLPAAAGGAVALDGAALQELNDNWTLKEKNSPGRPLFAGQPWAGVKLIKQADARFLPNTGGLVAERQIGRGRVVVSSFRLNQRELVNWRSFDSFFNSCVLRRPARKYELDSFGELRLNWESEPTRRYDPRLVTRVRYFSRDAGDAGFKAPKVVAQDQQNNGYPPPISYDYSALADNNDQMFELSSERAVSLSDPGVAGWNDYAPAADVARQSLKEAAGISVPRPSFVITVLCAYLVVLVPLNWAFFKMIGRVEMAWVAAPLISIVCAVLVIKLARLDIGFAQSRTEIATVELHAGHPRAHLTRYTALYTSLSGGYNLTFSDPTALVEPFASDSRVMPNQNRSTVTYERDEKVHLKNFDISSNSTGMLRSEQMFDVGGAVDWRDNVGGPPRVSNGTRHTLRGAGVVRCVKNGEGDSAIEGAWLGDLRPGVEAAAEFAPFEDSPFEQHLDALPVFAKVRPEDTLSLRPLVDLTATTKELTPGDARLIAYLEEELPGVEISPAPSQTRQVTLVVVNLTQAPLAAARPDVNTRADIKAQQNEIPLEPDGAAPGEAKPDANGDKPAAEKADPEKKPAAEKPAAEKPAPAPKAETKAEPKATDTKPADPQPATPPPGEAKPDTNGEKPAAEKADPEKKSEAEKTDPAPATDPKATDAKPADPQPTSPPTDSPPTGAEPATEKP